MTLTLDFVCVFDFNAFEVTAQVTGGDTHTAVTVLLLTWTVFILDVNQKTVQSDRQPAGTLLGLSHCKRTVCH